MSDFSDFCASGMSAAFTVVGTKSATILSVPYNAVIDQFSAARELEIGGFVGEYDATALIQAADMSAVTAPIERTLEGQTLTVDSRTFRIDLVHIDEAGVLLGLSNPNKRKK